MYVCMCTYLQQTTKLHQSTHSLGFPRGQIGPSLPRPVQFASELGDFIQQRLQKIRRWAWGWETISGMLEPSDSDSDYLSGNCRNPSIILHSYSLDGPSTSMFHGDFS